MTTDGIRLLFNVASLLCTVGSGQLTSLSYVSDVGALSEDCLGAYVLDEFGSAGKGCVAAKALEEPDCILGVQLLQQELHHLAKDAPERKKSAKVVPHRKHLPRILLSHRSAQRSALPRHQPRQARKSTEDIYEQVAREAREVAVALNLATVSNTTEDSSVDPDMNNLPTVLQLSARTVVMMVAVVGVPMLALYAMGTLMAEGREKVTLEGRRKKRSFCCGFCQCSSTTLLLTIFIGFFTWVSGYVLWKQGIIQPVLNEMLVYAYLIIVIIALFSLGIVEMYNDMSFLMDKIELLGMKARKFEESVMDSIPGMGQETEVEKAAKSAYNSFGTWSVRLDETVERMLSGTGPRPPLGPRPPEGPTTAQSAATGISTATASLNPADTSPEMRTIPPPGS